MAFGLCLGHHAIAAPTAGRTHQASTTSTVRATRTPIREIKEHLTNNRKYARAPDLPLRPIRANGRTNLPSGSCAFEGTSHLMEDTHVQQNVGSARLLAVFDGHGGTQCSAALKRAFPETAIRSFPEGAQMATLGNRWDAMNNLMAGLVPRAKAARRGCWARLAVRRLTGAGSTAVVGAVFSDHIMVANVGDSRAVLLRSSNTVVPLTWDHKPGHPALQKELKQDGYNVVPGGPNGPARVIHGRPSRFFPKPALSMARRYGGGVRPTPTIQSEPRTKNDRYLILGSDGLFDMVKDNELPGLVDKAIRKHGATPNGSAVSPEKQIANHLVNVAKKRWADATKQKWKGTEYSYRDDITVVVQALQP